MTRALLLGLTLAFAMPHDPAAAELSTIKAGDKLHGFQVKSVYLDATDRPLGARFTHPATGFQLDVLQIESVPQAFTWVKSFATSDQGEPHTQEHLLLLRGKAGRTLATKQSMTLVTHSAYTETWRTSYFFNTNAGIDTFFDVYAEQQHAMLHPDYSDGEIRLEVRNFGVTKNPDGTLRLEEKGTVYNEMVASMANGTWKAWRAQNHVVYGEKYPLGYNQGGEPAAIRTMVPKDIRDFHRRSHHLANMGTVAAFPKSAKLDDVLARFDRILIKDVPVGGKGRPADDLKKLPKPQGDPEGSIRIYEYPHANDQQPSPLEVVWPANRELDSTEQVLADLFFANIAGDATTNLYKLFIDGRTRKMDIGARSVASNVSEWGGYPIAVSFADVRPANMTDDGVKAIRAVVVDEVKRIAAFADGSPELKEFNDRIASRVTESERQAKKFIGTPPGFGFRGGNSQWVDLLLQLERQPGDRKSLVLKPEFAKVRELLATNKNFWREYLAKWNVTNTTPYISGAKPSTALIAREDAERKARLDEETKRLEKKYNVADAQEALKRYAADADREFAEIEKATKVPPTPFVKSPPMTLDDDLKYEAVKLGNGVPLVASRFDNMTGALTGIALRLDSVPRDELRYVSLLPALLTTVGVIENGKPVPYEEMRERLRKEILALTPSFSTNTRTGRVELVLRGSGIGLEESKRALDWMALVLYTPDWRPENLARIRDVVDQQLAGLRNTVQRPEEYWVNDPANAYRMQRHPSYLAADSFLTRTHNALRLRWMLKDAPSADADALKAFLAKLGETAKGQKRAEVKALLTGGKAPGLEGLSPSQRAIADDALRDLDLTLIEIPDATLDADFAYLVAAMSEDLATPATEALSKMESLRKRLLRTGGARMFLATSDDFRKALTPGIEAFAGRLENATFAPIWHATDGIIDARLRERAPGVTPLYTALYAPNKQGGVIVTSVPSAHYADSDDSAKQLDYLASRLYGGGGTHGVFSKTVGAGLAYSNGIRGSISSGRIGYYAERTPELPQTVRFVVGVVKDGKLDRSLGDYVLAQAFLESRASGTYEARAEGIAADLADGQPPEQVRKFREGILQLRKDPKLIDKLFERKDAVYARFIPGYTPKFAGVPDASYMVIGPDKQLDAWEEYLKESVSPIAKLYRLYGRDFWMP